MRLKFLLSIFLSFLVISFSYAEKKIYTEDEFLTLFNGKPKARIAKYLGEPEKKEIAVQPKGASAIIGRPTDEKGKKKKDNLDKSIAESFLSIEDNAKFVSLEETNQDLIKQVNQLKEDLDCLLIDNDEKDAEIKRLELELKLS